MAGVVDNDLSDCAAFYNKAALWREHLSPATERKIERAIGAARACDQCACSCYALSNTCGSSGPDAFG